MDKYILDYSDTSPFKGLKIYIDYLQEGLNFALKKDVKDIAIWPGDNEKSQTINFDFLEKKPEIKTFHVSVSLTKKSNIQGLYNLTSLKDFRWGVKNDFALDFSKLSSLVKLNISYSDKFLNWKFLQNLDNLFIQKVNTKNLDFLSGLINLNKLRINGGSLQSLKGIESCQNIEYIHIQACYKLVEVENILNQLPKLNGILIESCKKVDLSEKFISKWGEKIFIL